MRFASILLLVSFVIGYIFFNHVNPWFGLLLIILGIGFFIHKVFKFIKEKL